MAVHFATEIRFSSGESSDGMGRFWVEWDLPIDRDVETLWRFSVVNATQLSMTHYLVEVRSFFESTKACMQNKYGTHVYGFDGMYPCTYDNYYSMSAQDVCMGVGIWYNKENKYLYNDTLRSNTDWPNHSLDLPSFLSVWLH